MPSKPLPDWDHFACVAEEIGKDERLTANERGLMARAAFRMRADFKGASELRTIHTCIALRAAVEVLAARAAKRREAIETFNGTVDKMSRAARLFGKRPAPGEQRRKRVPKARATQDEPDENGGGRPVPVGGMPLRKPVPRRHEDEEPEDNAAGSAAGDEP